MVKTTRNQRRFAILGFLLGCCFPIIALAVLCNFEVWEMSLGGIFSLHQEHPLLWIINTAPLFLGLFAWFAGIQLDKLAIKNNELELRYREKLEADKVLKEKDAELEEAQRLSDVGEFAAGIAHEVNNPLAILKGKAQLLQLQIQSLNISQKEETEKINESVNVINDTVDHTADLIKNLKIFSSNDKFEALEFSSLRTVIDVALNISKSRCSHAGIDVRINIDENIEVECSLVSLSQVFLNLILNSIHAIESLEEKWIKIETKILENSIQVLITDSGNGIPADIAGKIMQPFFTTKDPGKGTGMGLSISQKAVVKMNGNLTYNSHSTHTQFILEFQHYRFDQPN